MKRRLNLLPLVGFLVCAVGMIGDPFVFARYPQTRDVPWVSWLLLVAGLGLIGLGLFRAFGRSNLYRGRIAGPIFGILGLAVTGLFAFVTLVTARELPASPNAPKVGQTAPAFVLPDTNGQPVALQTLLGPGKSWVLLIFYRGYW